MDINTIVRKQKYYKQGLLSVVKFKQFASYINKVTDKRTTEIHHLEICILSTLIISAFLNNIIRILINDKLQQITANAK